ncbi:hypothetical protein L1077_04195 [Pseudoalteromonas luteoviolacea]|uniref:hypothetical protein n=1 Tax=Pseudoalteromonas luteoviolacea TaxID=43657 RepID=UPI001F323D8A|nr:hypothetical protein [Pseudoalteromonas luteoviolacea]MCF6438628.1 hypothetical protein [Pseudoalteromonas luteoviolacea]
MTITEHTLQDVYDYAVVLTNQSFECNEAYMQHTVLPWYFVSALSRAAEMNVVDQEFAKNKISDLKLKYHLHKSTPLVTCDSEIQVYQGQHNQIKHALSLVIPSGYIFTGTNMFPQLCASFASKNTIVNTQPAQNTQYNISVIAEQANVLSQISKTNGVSNETISKLIDALRSDDKDAFDQWKQTVGKSVADKIIEAIIKLLLFPAS